MAGQVKQVTANERHLHDLSSPAESSSDGGNLSHVMRTTPTQRINVKLIPSPVASGHNGRGSQNLENMLQSILSMPDDESARHSKNVLSLQDQEDREKNLNVKQEVQEYQRGQYNQIDTTDTMKMYNSTIMKIVVT